MSSTFEKMIHQLDIISSTMKIMDERIRTVEDQISDIYRENRNKSYQNHNNESQISKNKSNYETLNYRKGEYEDSYNVINKYGTNVFNQNLYEKSEKNDINKEKFEEKEYQEESPLNYNYDREYNDDENIENFEEIEKPEEINDDSNIHDNEGDEEELIEQAYEENLKQSTGKFE